MPSSSDTTRGRSSTRRLPPDLATLNRFIQQRFQELREAIHLAGQARLKASERRSRQQSLLGEALGLSAADVAVIESARDGVPASVLLRLMHKYELSAQYFLTPETPLPPAFVIEQQRREFEALLADLRSSIPLAGTLRPRQRSAAGTGRKGGWLRGLPRNPKTPEQLAIRSLWEQARDSGFVPTTIEELRQWGLEHGMAVPEPAPVQPGPGRSRRGRARKASGSRAGKGRTTSRKGGWLKGLPRKPTTPDEILTRRIWEEARKQGRHFSSIASLKQWWAETGQADTLPAPEVDTGAAAGTERKAPAARTGKTRKPLVRRRRGGTETKAATKPQRRAPAEPSEGGQNPPPETVN